MANAKASATSDQGNFGRGRIQINFILNFQNITTSEFRFSATCSSVRTVSALAQLLHGPAGKVFWKNQIRGRGEITFADHLQHEPRESVSKSVLL